MSLSYWLVGDEMHFRLKGATEGWMALGFSGPAGGMIDADIIICSVQNGQVRKRIPIQRIFFKGRCS